MTRILGNKLTLTLGVQTRKPSTGAASRPKVAGNARQFWRLAFMSNQNATRKRSVSTAAANELHYARAA